MKRWLKWQIFNDSGFNLLESIVAMAMVGTAGIYFFKAQARNMQESKNVETKIIAQGIAESVANGVGTMASDEIYSLLKNENDNGHAPGQFLDSSSQSWLASWEKRNPLINKIEFKVTLYDDSGSSAALPADAEAFQRLDKEILVQIKYKTGPDSTPGIYTWSKLLVRQDESFIASENDVINTNPLEGGPHAHPDAVIELEEIA